MSDHEDSREPLLVVYDGVSYAVFGICITSALFYGLNEVPTLQFVTVSFVSVFVLSLASCLFLRSPSGGDDQ